MSGTSTLVSHSGKITPAELAQIPTPPTFTSAFKELEVIPQFRATAKLGAFLGGIPAR